MHLALLVESPDHVCTRYRFRAFEPLLRQAGHTLTMHELPSNFLGRLAIGKQLRDADVVVVQRKLLSWAELKLLRRRVKRLWFDFDDALWMRDSFSGKGFASAKREGRFRRLMKSCDLAIAGNEYLAQHARNCGVKAAIVIPTCVDVQHYPMATHKQPGGDLVWIGSASTLQGLQANATTLEAIGQAVPSVRLKLVCDTFLKLQHLPVVEVPWSEANEASEIATSAIGISWIPDDPWSRGKCGLKILQYMAAGLPVVTNPVGVHPEMVRHGDNGFLATTTGEWVEAIRTLGADSDLRRRMGARSRAMVEERYSVEAGARMWCNQLAAVTP